MGGRPPRQRSIEITATARVMNEAEVATVHVGYEFFAPDKDAAYAEASKASNAIMDALRGAGVEKSAIESETQSVAPTDQYQLNDVTDAERRSRAFTAAQSWTVRVDAAEAARVLDVAVKAGANKSGAIDWSLRIPDAASAAAATKALQRARAQADAMASGLGVKLGELLYASNAVETQPIPDVNGMQMALAKMKVPLPLAINARQIETSATVHAVFAIE
jgi:hypothetical protein